MYLIFFFLLRHCNYTLHDNNYYFLTKIINLQGIMGKYKRISFLQTICSYDRNSCISTSLASGCKGSVLLRLQARLRLLVEYCCNLLTFRFPTQLNQFVNSLGRECLFHHFEKLNWPRYHIKILQAEHQFAQNT